MIPVKTDLEEGGKDLLLYQFGDKKNITSLLGAYLDDLGNVEQDLFDLINNFNVDSATGVYLDYIGSYVGEKRLGESDTDYRERILRRILINTSDGTPNTLLSIVENITESGNVKLWEHFPLFSMYYTDGNSATVETLKVLKEASPITSELALIVDTTRQGWAGAEFYNQEGNLVDNLSNNIVDEFNNSIVLKSEGGINEPLAPKGQVSILSEILDQADTLVDDLGNNIVDNNNEQFIIFNTSGNVFSNNGVFTEVIT